MNCRVLRAGLFGACAINLFVCASARADAAPKLEGVREEIIVTTSADKPQSQTLTSINQKAFENSPAFNIGQVLQYSPGVAIKQGNGPRDIGISIRGSGARNGFGVRNIVMFEGGFPVTQPDGLSRTDLTDPHAYSGIDVYRGPSSALFGNYATGGAVNFRTRSGGAIDGVEAGIDGGKFGYLNGYATAGKKYEQFEYAVFVSHVRGNGHVSSSDFDTTTVNGLVSFTPSSEDKLTLKIIHNDLNAHLSTRLSLSQYYVNPLQQGCEIAAGAAAGCGTVNLLVNGLSGATTPQTAAQAGLGRNDQRSIVGVRWEHSFDADTTLRTQIVYDVKDIAQPTGATSAKGVTPSVNIMSDITRDGSLFGLEATHFAGVFLNTIDSNGYTYNVMPGGNATIGGLTATTFGRVTNFGARFREDVQLSPAWRAVVGVGLEYSKLGATNTAYRYTGTVATTTALGIARHFFNVAPEAALFYAPDDMWQLRGRFSSGYGIPQASNLFVTPAGVNGNNTSLTPQKNFGFDLGADWTPIETLKIGATGFYEFFKNEFISQSPGPGLLNYTFNVPKSVHRGVEVVADWKPVEGFALSASYTFNDQVYTRYSEQLSAGTRTTIFDRSDNKIPGVEPHNLSTRVAYDQPSGRLAGFGGFIEMNYRDRFSIDNANLVQVPDATLFNLNIHYNHDLTGSAVKGFRVFVEVQNLMDRRYVASANNISNSINAATGLQNPASTVFAAGGAIYAGAPRNIVGGMKVKF